MTIETPGGVTSSPTDLQRSVVELAAAIVPLLAHEMAVEQDRLLDMNDLLQRLPFSRKVVLRMIHEGRIPAYELNDKWVISRTDFVSAMQAGFPLPSGRHRTSSRSR